VKGKDGSRGDFIHQVSQIEDLLSELYLSRGKVECNWPCKCKVVSLNGRSLEVDTNGHVTWHTFSSCRRISVNSDGFRTEKCLMGRNSSSFFSSYRTFHAQ